MEVNPVLLRHLRGSVRRNTLYWLLMIYLLIASALFLLVFTLAMLGSKAHYQSLYDFFVLGQALFWTATAVQIVTAWLFAPLPALGMLAGERGSRTLPLLQLTTCSRLSITLGKMGAVLLEGGLFIITPLPVFFYGFWMGGISFTELALALIILLATFLGSVAIAMVISAYTNNTIVAVLVYYGLIFISWGVASIISSLISPLSRPAFAASVSDSPALLILIEVLPVLLSSLYPISAAIATENYWLDQHRWLFIQIEVPIPHRPMILYLPSPWLIYTFLIVLLVLWSIRIVTRRLQRKER